MRRFDRLQIKDLKDYLYQSDIHDAKIKTFRYDREQRNLTMEAVNAIHGVIIKLTFFEVQVVLSLSGVESGSRETIISLTAEEDSSFLQNCMQACGDCFGDSLYLLFQMFSGDELHIVSREMFVEIIK